MIKIRQGSIYTPKNINLYYEDMGRKKDPVIILIMGLGAQLTVWPDSLCKHLTGKGFRVIRFDNRDVGLSSRLEEHGSPNLARIWLQKRFKRRPESPYRLKHMAKDVVHLMNALEIQKAHIVGASMGGMIGQILAAKHKKRVLSLTSIMSTTSHPKLPKSKLRVLLKIGKRPSFANTEAMIKYVVKMNHFIGSPTRPIDEVYLYEQAEKSVNRTKTPPGFKRQLAAIASSGDRSKLIQKIKVPTLVIHGADDPIIPVEAGIDTADKIDNAKLKIIEDMGHNFPDELSPKLAKLISKHAKRAS